MPYFHLHLKTDSVVAEDEFGIELASLEEAKHEALLSAREILADAIRAGQSHIPDAFLITDDSGQTLHTLPFSTLLPEAYKK